MFLRYPGHVLKILKQFLLKVKKSGLKCYPLTIGKKPGQYKIALSMKQIDGDPWDQDLPVKVAIVSKAQLRNV
jgi:hypothetical protein